MKNKLFKKLFTIGLPLVVIVCIFSGCPTTGGGKEIIEPGTLTITGIPAEYAGKFVHVNELRIPVTNADGKKSNITVTFKDTAVKNGEVKLLIYIKPIIDIPFSKPDGYAGSDTVTVEISFLDSTAGYGTDAVFEPVTFKNGVADVKWEDAFKAGYLTVTGIPEQYNDRNANIYIGEIPAKSLTRVPFPDGGRSLISETVRNGAIISKIPPREGNKYESYTFTGTKDILVTIPNGKERPFISVIGNDPSLDYFLFKDAQITNGKINLDLRRSTPYKL